MGIYTLENDVKREKGAAYLVCLRWNTLLGRNDFSGFLSYRIFLEPIFDKLMQREYVAMWWQVGLILFQIDSLKSIETKSIMATYTVN